VTGDDWADFTDPDTGLPYGPGNDIVKALTPWAKRNGIEPHALPALLNLIAVQQVMLATEAEDGGESC
jgi:hypothetical protein